MKSLLFVVPSGRKLKLTHSPAHFAWGIYSQGSQGTGFASYVFQGYGTGTEQRDRLATIQAGEAITAVIVNNSIEITNGLVGELRVSVVLNLGDIPNGAII